MAVQTRLQLRQLIVGRGVKELAHRHRIAVKHFRGGDLPIAKLDHVDYRYVKPLLDGGGLKSPKHDGMVRVWWASGFPSRAGRFRRGCQ
jgi:hypothetical protein